MQITKNIDHYFFENEHGSYHLSIPKYNELGKEKAIKFVTEEIRKKSRKFTGDKINFNIARSLGFCEYGIKDFCNQLELDVNKTYEIEFLKSILTKKVVSVYFDECFKLFGMNVFDKWGGVISYLEKTKEICNILRVEIIPEYNLHLLSVKFAYSVLDNFEKEFPEDIRPRKAIKYKEAYVRGDITLKQLKDAESAAWSAESAMTVQKDKQIKEVVKVLKRLGY